MTTQDKIDMLRSMASNAVQINTAVAASRQVAFRFGDNGYGTGGANAFTQQDLDDLEITSITLNDLNNVFQSLDALHRIYDDGEDPTELDDATLVLLARIGWGLHQNKMELINI